MCHPSVYLVVNQGITGPDVHELDCVLVSEVYPFTKHSEGMEDSCFLYVRRCGHGGVLSMYESAAVTCSTVSQDYYDCGIYAVHPHCSRNDIYLRTSRVTRIIRFLVVWGVACSEDSVSEEPGFVWIRRKCATDVGCGGLRAFGGPSRAHQDLEPYIHPGVCVLETVRPFAAARCSSEFSRMREERPVYLPHSSRVWSGFMPVCHPLHVF